MTFKNHQKLKNIINEILNQGGWTSGNAINIIIKNNGSTGDNNRSFQSTESTAAGGGETSSAYVVIEYGDISSQTLTAKSSIEKEILQTITTKGNIGTGIETRTQTINAKLDIAIWSKRSDIWQFEITAQYTRTKTIQSKASIKKEL